MSNAKKSDWTPLPPDMVALIFSPAIIAGIGILISSLFWRLLRGGVLAVFAVGVVTGVIGVVLLFLARLPLYGSGQFFAVGPRLLDTSHRRLYRRAYGFVIVSVLLLVLLLIYLY